MKLSKVKSIVLILCAGVLLVSTAKAAEKSEDTWPRGCTLEDWCVYSATACFVGYVENYNGLFRAHSRYSVVRQNFLLCKLYTGEYVRRTVMGPVEANDFVGRALGSEISAQTDALERCERYREDWLTAAPRC